MRPDDRGETDPGRRQRHEPGQPPAAPRAYGGEGGQNSENNAELTGAVVDLRPPVQAGRQVTLAHRVPAQRHRSGDGQRQQDHAGTGTNPQKLPAARPEQYQRQQPQGNSGESRQNRCLVGRRGREQPFGTAPTHQPSGADWNATTIGRRSSSRQGRRRWRATSTRTRSSTRSAHRRRPGRGPASPRPAPSTAPTIPAAHTNTDGRTPAAANAAVPLPRSDHFVRHEYPCAAQWPTTVPVDRGTGPGLARNIP